LAARRGKKRRAPEISQPLNDRSLAAKLVEKSNPNAANALIPHCLLRQYRHPALRRAGKLDGNFITMPNSIRVGATRTATNRGRHRRIAPTLPPRHPAP
jgi:hypothetical protein